MASGKKLRRNNLRVRNHRDQPKNKPIPQPDISTQAINARIRAATAHTFPGLSLEDRLAKLLGVAPMVAQELANGDRFYNTGMLEVIASKTGIAPAILFAGNAVAAPQPIYEERSEEISALLKDWERVTPDAKSAMLFILEILVGENNSFERLDHPIKVSVLSSLRQVIQLGELIPELVYTTNRALVSAIDRYQISEEELSSASPINTPLHVLAGQVLPGVEHVEGFA